MNQNTFNTGCFWQVWSDRTGIGPILACRGDTGNVGIRNTNPSSTLDVTGTFNVSGNFTGSGNVGIGISPSYRLDVADGSSSASFSGSLYFGVVPGVGNTGTALVNAVGSTSYNNVSCYIRGSLLVGRWTAAVSDERIKKDIQDINDDVALQKLLLIQPKTYKYIDNIGRGDTTIYGFIAQQIRQVIPEAVKIINDYIPNIYKLYDVSGDIITTDDDLTNKLKVNDKIEYLLQSSGDKYHCKILEISPTEIKIDKVIGENDNKIFIFGKEVDDFHSLSKEYIFTLNVCATQELHRLLLAQKQIIELQQQKINELETNLINVNSNLARII
ncbi:MAG: tail fiber domain-containing protein, partial [Chitinophagia bacterium]|nr:tail fiber domain-containing protein [Chitinophagia bacterium]